MNAQRIDHLKNSDLTILILEMKVAIIIPIDGNLSSRRRYYLSKKHCRWIVVRVEERERWLNATLPLGRF